MTNDGMGDTSRRGFLGTAAAGFMIFKPETVFGSQANSAIELGIVGCGSRGAYVGGLFMEYTGARIVALADTFADRSAAITGTLKLSSPPRVYTGLHGHEELAHSKVDAVVVTSPPYFHPDHVESALAAGKHVYMAKPLAVDVPGCMRIQAAADKAKSLSAWADWQTRMSPAFQEVARRIFAGDIGTPVTAAAAFLSTNGKVKDTTGLNPSQARLRNWNFDRVLSGNLMVEQSLHSLDVANWYLRARPLQAFGTGGRRVRTNGDGWDQFFATLWYPNNVQLQYSGSQFLRSGAEIYTKIYGTLGKALATYYGAVSIEGEKPFAGPVKDPTMGYTSENTKLFAQSLREGKPINNVATGVESTLSAILARIAAERQQVVTWDQMIKENEKLEANLKL